MATWIGPRIAPAAGAAKAASEPGDGIPAAWSTRPGRGQDVARLLVDEVLDHSRVTASSNAAAAATRSFDVATETAISVTPTSR